MCLLILNRYFITFATTFFFCLQAMTMIGDRRNKEAAEKMAKERELLKVSIKKEDVDLIVSYVILL
jgi:hypothetical protein